MYTIKLLKAYKILINIVLLLDVQYVPTEVLRDFKITIPKQIGIRDEKGNEWITNVQHWKDNRIWIDL